MLNHKKLLELSESEKKLSIQAATFIETDVYKAKIVRYNQGQNNFSACKEQLIQLLDFIVSLNKSDFDIFEKYKNNVKELIPTNSIADISITLGDAKTTLEYALLFILASPKKIEKSHLNSFEVTSCYLGAFSNILDIVNLYTATQLREKICLAKKAIIRATAVEYIKNNRLLEIENGQILDGNEIHWVNGLFNLVARRYGLDEINDPLISRAGTHYYGFQYQVSENLNCFSIINHIAMEIVLPVSLKKYTYDQIEFLFRMLGISDNTQANFGYNRLFDEPDLTVRNAKIDYRWTAKNNFAHHFQLLLIDLFQCEGYISGYKGKLDNLHIVVLDNTVAIVGEHNELRYFCENDISYIRKNFYQLELKSKNSFLHCLEALSFEVFFSILNVNTYHLDIFALILKMKLTIEQKRMIGFFLKKIEKDADPKMSLLFSAVLYCAAMNGHVEIVDKLLASGADANAKSPDGISAIYIAAYNGHLPVVIKLIENDANVDAVQPDGSTSLHAAASNRHSYIARKLLIAGANPDVKTRNGKTALYLAMQNHHISFAEILFEYGADGNQVFPDGSTPLHYAAKYEDPTLVKVLVKHKVELNPIWVHCGEKRTPIFIAALHNNLSTIEILLDNGANALKPCTINISILLEEAERQNKSQSLMKLLERRLQTNNDPSSKVSEMQLKKFSPLHVAIVFRHKRIIDYLEKWFAKGRFESCGCIITIDELKEIFMPVHKKIALLPNIFSDHRRIVKKNDIQLLKIYGQPLQPNAGH